MNDEEEYFYELDKQFGVVNDEKDIEDETEYLRVLRDDFCFAPEEFNIYHFDNPLCWYSGECDDCVGKAVCEEEFSMMVG